MNVVQEIKRINEQELEQGLSEKASWHHEYKDSAWVYAGGFSYDLSEGDVLCVMSQWGEIEDINLCREKDTGKSKGFCFIKYEDQRSTILAVDNFNGIQLLGRTLRVDHKHKYGLPKDVREREEKLEEERVARGEAPRGAVAQWRPGVAYEGKTLASAHNFHKGVDVFAAPDKGSASSDDSDRDGGAGGSRDGESAEGKRIRKEVKRARKEARRQKREQKEHKRHKSGDKKKNKKHSEDVGDDGKGGKGRRRESKSNGDNGNSSNGASARGKEHDGMRDGFGERPRDNDDDGDARNRDEVSRADAAGTWERGVRDGAPSSASFASGRAELPPTLSTGNVLDWRGLGGRGGGRGGRGGRDGGRGGRDGGRGRGRVGERDGGRGGGGTDSYGGMNRMR